MHLQISRRRLIQWALGTVLGGTALEIISSCGGGGQSVTQLDPGNFVADRDGSVLDVTTDFFGASSQFNTGRDDYQIVYISLNNRALLSGLNLVFEINNSGELVGSGVSATKTFVKRGDVIHWKSLA
jgi:hypothetical protein